MAAGSAFTDAQRHRVDEAVAAAREQTGLAFSVFVGDLDGEPRPMAERLHAAVAGEGDEAVLLLVAPGQRRLEIVTTPGARERLPDRACALATLSMTSSFAGGDLVGGIVSGLRMLADGSASTPADRH
ncbi:MAG: DUF5130 domain-containing protein [Actinomycetota bacterium]|nr:DUF5130 domain-containing protein [Actinomycetota bacterium]